MTDYGAWLDQLAGAEGDAFWKAMHEASPPADALQREQLRGRLIALCKQKKISAPARIADAWLNPPASPSDEGGCVGSEQRAQVHKPPPLAFGDDILGDLIKDLGRLGHVGEERACKLVYLSATSRLLDKIVSLVAKGPSAAGKSATIDRVLSFFPDEATVRLSGMSEKYLVYNDRPIAHKMLVLHEAAGMSGEYASYLIRTLLSEGCLRHGTVESTSEGLKPVLIERPGPAGLITSTTQIDLHSENETRLISIPIDDTRDQTKRVMGAIARNNGEVVDLERWHQLQYWLTDGERRVVVPFAGWLANLIPPVAVRLRRDFGAVLGLVRAHALLNRARRDIDEDARIIAVVEDYEKVRELVADLISDAVGATVSEATRETVGAVSEIIGTDTEYATNARLAERLKIDRSAIYRRVNKAISQGYLVNDEDRRRKPTKLKLGEPLPEDLTILPEPDCVAGLCTCAPHSDPPQGDVHGTDSTDGSFATPAAEEQEFAERLFDASGEDGSNEPSER